MIGSAGYYQNNAGRVDSRINYLELAADFQNSDHANLKFSHTYECLPVRLRLAPGVAMPVGAYNYGSVLAGYNFGSQRKRAVANVSVEQGTFYSGHKTTLAITNGLLAFPPRLMMEPTYQVDRVTLPEGSFTSQLFGPRVTNTFRPDMFASARLRYDSIAGAMSTNLRFR